MSLTQYLLEFSICLALFYGLYHTLLRKETFFQLNRWYLLLSPVASMIIPFLDVDLTATGDPGSWDRVVVPLISDIQQQQLLMWESLEKPTAPSWNFTYLDLLLLIYLIGVVWLAARLIYRTWRLMRLIGRGQRESRSGYTVVTSDEKIPAASFLSYVFWQEGTLTDSQRNILEHELVHVRQWHSLDVILMEIWVMLKWFHPLIYWYRDSLRLTHEYIADAYVSRKSGSRLEYARLLTNSQTVAVHNPLLHQFHSSLKMRLLMLAQKQSSYWRYLKLLSILPVTALLLSLFSFDLAEELPDPLVKPLADIEQNINDLAQQPLLTRDQPGIVADIDKSYLLKWGDLECVCKSEQYPNFYRCENQRLLPKELRRLIRREGGFELLLDNQPQPIRELTAVSKFMKDMGGFPGQFDEMDRQFNTDSPLWKQAEKGDVFRFTFNNGSGDYFQFELVVDNRRSEFFTGTLVEIGDFHFNLSQINQGLSLKGVSPNVVSMDVEELKNFVDSPLKIRKNAQEYYTFTSATIRNYRALREDNYQRINTQALDLSRSKPILEAFPDDRILINLTTKEEEKLDFEILLRKNSAWDGRSRAHAIEWGDLRFGIYEVPILTKSEIEALKSEKMYLFANGRRHLLKDITITDNFVEHKNDQIIPVSRSIHGVKGAIEEMLPRISPGRTIFLGRYKSVDGYLTPNVSVFIDVDWKTIFPDHPNAKVTADNSLVIENPQPADLEKLIYNKNFMSQYYQITVDGEVFKAGVASPYKSIHTVVAEKQLPRKRLVVSRLSPMQWKGH